MVLIINSAGLATDQTVEKQSRALPYSSATLVSSLRKRNFVVAHVDLRNKISPRLSSQLSLDDFDAYLSGGTITPLMEEFLTKILE